MSASTPASGTMSRPIGVPLSVSSLLQSTDATGGSPWNSTSSLSVSGCSASSSSGRSSASCEYVGISSTALPASAFPLSSESALFSCVSCAFSVLDPAAGAAQAVRRMEAVNIARAVFLIISAPRHRRNCRSIDRSISHSTCRNTYRSTCRNSPCRHSYSPY